MGIAGQLRAGAKTVKQLAEETKSQEDSLYRVLRALASCGIFEELEGKQFRLTAAAEALRSDVPGSLRLTAEVMGEDRCWNSWGALAHTAATGETGFDHVYGKSTWDWFAEHPGPGSLFNAFQSQGAVASPLAVTAAYDLGPYRVVADIGGREGILLSTVLKANAQKKLARP